MAPLPPTTLFTERISQYVSLPPSALNTPLPALCANVFSPLLLSYFAPARGIVLAYEDVKLSSRAPTSGKNGSTEDVESDNEEEEVMLRHVDEYAMPFIWATATFLVFRPVRNSHITARIVHSSKTHITLSYLNIFPVSVLAAQLPSGWSFEGGAAGEGEAVWKDEQGGAVEGDLSVRVVDFDGRTDGKSKGKGVRLEGSLVGEEEARGREKGKGKEREKVRKGILKA